MLNMCVESELNIVGNTLLVGWVGGWMDGSQSRVKDCLQQSTRKQNKNNIEYKLYFGRGRLAQGENTRFVKIFFAFRPWFESRRTPMSFSSAKKFFA